MQNIRGKQVLAYTILPGIIPRIQSFAENGFGWLAFLMATLYHSVRLLPTDHPYLDPANRGKYGVRHVIAQAANNLIIKKSNIDQIVIFLTLLLGFVLLVLQFALLVGGFIMQAAHAAGPSFGGGMFSTPYPQEDIAFTLLDKVLGVPGVFALQSTTPFHIALHGLFEFYSLAMLIVAVIIVLYYILIIIGETAQTGTPFGKRFSHIWAPIRLVVALGLLIPIAYGMNSGQYITLYAAKMGSGLATNGWILFNQSLNNGLGTNDQSMLARPRVPDTATIAKFIAMARTCKEAYERVLNLDMNHPTVTIDPYLVKNPLINQKIPTNSAGYYNTALQFYKKNDIIIRFGAPSLKHYSTNAPPPLLAAPGSPPASIAAPTLRDTTRFLDEVGGVKPYCGEIVVRTNDVTQIGALEIQEGYFNMVLRLWDSPRMIGFAEVMAYRHLPMSQHGCSLQGWSMYGHVINCDKGVKSEFIRQLLMDTHSQFDATVASARQKMLASSNFAIPDEVMRKGWGGAGIWYNRIAEMNGALFSAAYNVPSPNLLPIPMAKITESRRAHDENISGAKFFSPNQSSGDPINFRDNNDALVANVLYNAYTEWGEDDVYLESDVSSKQNIIIDTLNFLFGIDGLFSMRENKDIHPLAQLVGIGKGIVDS